MENGPFPGALSLLEMIDSLKCERALLRSRVRDLEIDRAYYKALFHCRGDIAVKLDHARQNNVRARLPEFDGFCYDSSRRGVEPISLDDLFFNQTLSAADYDFCRGGCP